ncbi:MAG: undecaprenyldiphospho-muramoylpentapeptide beta-N-acetylglucosaminyltransferase [Ruminococcaceae bacterium]|nr:undecaprenyldiphospho-muramoylpentapeptide beta-N-acetylglucosaminyltransferase [Oscillospiraceae bacterium]
MKVLFVGGGTAGHINPALAAAGYLKSKVPDAEILFVGNKGGMEERLVPPAGYNMKTIHISGFQRKLSFENIIKNVKTVARLVTSSIESKKIIKEFAPDVCVGTGGYVCGPVLREAAKMGIPCVVHESNAFPGVTVKMLSKDMETVMLCVEDAKKYFDPSVNIVITGNPVRGEMLTAQKEKSKEKLGLDSRPVVLSFGGSLGAEKINNAMIDVLKYSAENKEIQHIHGYGQLEKEYPEKLKAAGFDVEANPHIRVLDYINNMADCLAAADVVISRAGAITLTEIEALGKASILIPSPNVAENHQYHNAMALVNRGAAEIIEEKDLTGELLLEKVKLMFGENGKAEKLGAEAKKMSVPDASEKIHSVIMAAAEKGKRK